MKHILAFLSAALAVYLTTAYANYEPSPRQWNDLTRSMSAAAFWILFLLIELWFSIVQGNKPKIKGLPKFRHIPPPPKR